MELPRKDTNWFSPAEKESRSYRYSYDDFTQQIQNQIARQLRVEKDTRRCGPFYLEDIEIVLEKHLYQVISETIDFKDESYFPLLTFHSTQNLSKLQGILRYGNTKGVCFQLIPRLNNFNAYFRISLTRR